MSLVMSIYQNDMINIVHDACKLCYKGKSEEDDLKKLKYISDKVKRGHESVTEHSNIVMLIMLDMDDDLTEVVEIQAAGNHLNFVPKKFDGKLFLAIGGSTLAYKQIFKNMKNGYNSIARAILDNLYYQGYAEFFRDFTDAGLMEVKRFRTVRNLTEEIRPLPIEDTSVVKITNIDPIDSVVSKLNSMIFNYTGVEEQEVFKYDDVLELCTVTVYFESVSRIITQQITRHRNAISQKSQRYVDEGEGIFIDPMRFQPQELKDKYPIYDNDAEFEVVLIEGEEPKTIKMSELEQMSLNIYGALRGADMRKEDARYYLFQGVESSLYVTMTYKHLLHFLMMRTDIHAQIENRLMACAIDDALSGYAKEIGFGGENANYLAYLTPMYMLDSCDYDMDAYIKSLEAADSDSDLYEETEEIVEEVVEDGKTEEVTS